MENLKTCKEIILEINEVKSLTCVRMEYRPVLKESKGSMNLRMRKSPTTIQQDWKILSLKNTESVLATPVPSMWVEAFDIYWEVREIELVFKGECPLVLSEDLAGIEYSPPHTLFGHEFVLLPNFKSSHNDLECWVINDKEITHYNVRNTALFSPPTRWKQCGKTIWNNHNTDVSIPF